MAADELAGLFYSLTESQLNCICLHRELAGHLPVELCNFFKRMSCSTTTLLSQISLR
jgi:hypothetical protein